MSFCSRLQRAPHGEGRCQGSVGMSEVWSTKEALWRMEVELVRAVWMVGIQ